MCSGFGLTNFSRFSLEERYDISLDDYSDEQLFKHRFAPKGFIPSISRNSPTRCLLRYWSLVPPWVNELKELQFSTFNARAESISQKPAFQAAWKKARRCLIPATHFFEWQKTYDDNKKLLRQPYTIRVKNQPIFSIAGLYQPWEDFETCTIITTEPNEEMKAVHDRMPVIITPKDESAWLEKTTDFALITQLLKPYADGGLDIQQGIA